MFPVYANATRVTYRPHCAVKNWLEGLVNEAKLRNVQFVPCELRHCEGTDGETQYLRRSYFTPWSDTALHLSIFRNKTRKGMKKTFCLLVNVFRVI